jgi:two-component sensor histidine kinase
VRADLTARLYLFRNGIELRIANIVADVEVLARSPALQRGDFDELRRHAIDVVQMLGAFAVVLADRDGRELVNTREPANAPQRRRRYVDTMNRVFATGHAQVPGTGEIIAAVQACYDVTDDHEAMRRQQILLDEINHRVKNTLATVQSIARASLSSATTLRGYAEAFEQRLIALSRAYNLLTENNWEGADLATIVRRTLAPFAGAGRTTLSGPPVALTPKLTLAVSAAIQELSTNAAKYGALSVEQGDIDVTWARESDGVIAFRWTERDGPAVEKPARRGFGTRLIQDILAADPVGR